MSRNLKRTQSEVSLEDTSNRRPFLKPRGDTLEERMRPLEKEDLFPKSTNQSKKSPLSKPQRHGQGVQKRRQESRRTYINNGAVSSINAHFNTKLDLADSLAESFSFVGNQGVPSTPPRVVEIETATVREIVSDSIEMAKGKVKGDFFTPEFEPALMHVTAYHVASKLYYAHMTGGLGCTEGEVLPERHKRMEEVRSTVTTTLAPIAYYINQIGNFEVDGTLHVPYLRRLRRADTVTSWQPDDIHLHHSDQLYSGVVRANFGDFGVRADARALAIRSGIPVRAPPIYGVPIDPGYDGPEHMIVQALPPGRDLVADIQLVIRTMSRLKVKYDKIITGIDVTGGRGSPIQTVALGLPEAYVPASVWSSLPLQARDLYIGAAMGFCREHPGLAYPAFQHPDCLKVMHHFALTGCIVNWISNFMAST